MNCDECNDNGYTLVADQQHDVMMRVQCVPCLAHERMKHDLSVKIIFIITYKVILREKSSILFVIRIE